MKKSVALFLALVVVFSLSVSAFATGSATGTGTTVYAVPAAKTVATLVELGKADSLGAEAKAAFEAAYADLENVAPEGYTANYFCYASAKKYPADVTVAIADITDAVAKLYANGAWQDVACKVNGGKVTLSLPCEGALAIFTK